MKKNKNIILITTLVIILVTLFAPKIIDLTGKVVQADSCPSNEYATQMLSGELYCAPIDGLLQTDQEWINVPSMGEAYCPTGKYVTSYKIATYSEWPLQCSRPGDTNLLPVNCEWAGAPNYNCPAGKYITGFNEVQDEFKCCEPSGLTGTTTTEFGYLTGYDRTTEGQPGIYTPMDNLAPTNPEWITILYRGEGYCPEGKYITAVDSTTPEEKIQCSQPADTNYLPINCVVVGEPDYTCPTGKYIVGITDEYEWLLKCCEPSGLTTTTACTPTQRYPDSDADGIDEYCDASGNLLNQKSDQDTCTTNYECQSNICTGKCLSYNYLQELYCTIMQNILQQTPDQAANC